MPGAYMYAWVDDETGWVKVAVNSDGELLFDIE